MNLRYKKIKSLKESTFSLTKDNVINLLNEIAIYADQLAEDARELTYSLDNGELNSIPRRDHAGLDYIEIKNRMEKILNSNMVEGLNEALYGMNQIEQFVKMADAIGLKTMDDFKDFMDREGQGKDVLTALYDYLHNEIGDLDFQAKDESLKESYQDVDSMSREELMDEIDGIYEWALKGKHIDITSIIEDPEVFPNDKDDEEGYFKGVPTDKLRGILKILRKMKDGGSLTKDDIKLLTSKDESLKEGYLENIKDPVYWQHQVDYQLEHFGRVGGGLIQDLDEAGFYLDADNKVVKKLHEDTIKDPKIKWTFIKSKEVEDSDGFLTDYTWYEGSDGTQVMIFGDNDIYKPEDGYFDITFTDRKQAEDWFNSY